MKKKDRIRFIVLPYAALLLSLLAGCPKREPPRENVVNPMIDSAEKFVTVFVETLPPPQTGLDVFLGILSGRQDSADTSQQTSESLAPRAKESGLEQPKKESARQTARKADKGTIVKLDTAEPVYHAGTVEITGTVHYQGLEGGFWGITGDNGQNYEPLNLPDELKQAGIKVRLYVRIRKDIATVRMWGIPVQIVGYVTKSRKP